MNELPEPSIDVNIEERYRKIVDSWLSLSDPAVISEIYEKQVFPLAMENMRQAWASQPPVDLLVLPVGTQKYSPRLVTVAIPARKVGLIATSQSAAIASELATVLEGEKIETDLRVSSQDGVSRQEIGDIGIRIYRTAGEPEPSKTLFDLTSGRKPMVAALASVADALGAMNCYLEASFHRPPHGGFATAESLHIGEPLNISAVTRTLEAARALARAGYCKDAAKYIAGRGKNQYLPPPVRAANQLFSAFQKLIEKNPEAAARAFRRAIRELPAGTRLHSQLEDAWAAGWNLLARGDHHVLDVALRELGTWLRLSPDQKKTRKMLPQPASVRSAFRNVFSWLLTNTDEA